MSTNHAKAQTTKTPSQTGRRAVFPPLWHMLIGGVCRLLCTVARPSAGHRRAADRADSGLWAMLGGRIPPQQADSRQTAEGHTCAVVGSDRQHRAQEGRPEKTGGEGREEKDRQDRRVPPTGTGSSDCIQSLGKKNILYSGQHIDPYLFHKPFHPPIPSLRKNYSAKSPVFGGQQTGWFYDDAGDLHPVLRGHYDRQYESSHARLTGEPARDDGGIPVWVLILILAGACLAFGVCFHYLLEAVR